MIERQIQGILAYPQTRNAKTAEIASALAESQEQGVDIYYYYLKNGRLFSPTHKIPVVDSTASPRDRELIEQIESWVNQNQEGTAIWISPPTENGEVSTKITVLQLLGGNTKIVKNTSALVDSSSKMVQEIIDYTVSFSINPLEELDLLGARYQLIILREEIPPLISDLFKESWEDHKRRIRQALEITRASKTNPQIARTIFASHIGTRSLSCPTMEFRGAYARVSETGIRFLECTCPFCGLKVKAKIEGGKIYCPACQRSAPYHC